MLDDLTGDGAPDLATLCATARQIHVMTNR